MTPVNTKFYRVEIRFGDQDGWVFDEGNMVFQSSDQVGQIRSYLVECAEAFADHLAEVGFIAEKQEISRHISDFEWNKYWANQAKAAKEKA